MTLGEHPVIRPRINEVFGREREHLRRYAFSRGVRESDVDDVIQNASLKLCRLKPMSDIAALADAWSPTAENKDQLHRALVALALHYLDYAVGEWRRGRGRDPDSLDQKELADSAHGDPAFIPWLSTALGGVTQEDVASLSKGVWPVSRTFWEKMARFAGLKRDEMELMLYLSRYPEGRQQDFDRSLSESRISRMKSRAADKIVRCVGVVEDQEETSRSRLTGRLSDRCGG